MDAQTNGILYHNRAILPAAERRRVVHEEGTARFWITNHYRRHALEPVSGQHRLYARD